MTPAIQASDVPTNPNTRHSWVLYQFHLRKISLNRLGRENDVSSTALSGTFYRPAIRCEAILAKALGLKPHHLFPERYDASGNRAPHLVRNKTTTLQKRGNGKSAGDFRHAR
ncbi:MAG: helix-turn-helix domain-containing protein [Alphaproteobacteria bacterium]|nr:helix-turn-helix domain-containing protein [Alphaproteobacteria bacterium]